MKQVMAVFGGMMVGGIVVGALAIAGLSVTALVGVLLFVGLPAEPSIQGTSRAPVSRQAPATRTGELHIASMAAATFRVDGVELPYEHNGTLTHRVPAGDHLLQAFNLFNKEVARQTVNVPRGKRVMLEYRAKSFNQVGTVPASTSPAAPRTAPAPAPAPTAPAPTAARVSPPQAAAAPPSGIRNPFKGLQLGGRSEKRTKRTSTQSSEQYGEVRTSSPGRDEVHGYRDQQADGIEEERRTGFAW